MQGRLRALVRDLGKQGFSIIELLVTISIIVILTSVTIVSIHKINIKKRDSIRLYELNRFRQKLELYKSEHGSYVCGDACTGVQWGGRFYSFNCSINAQLPYAGDDPKEVDGFLNGGNCCNLNLSSYPSPLPPTFHMPNYPNFYSQPQYSTSTPPFPAPTSINDDIGWGLYADGLLDDASNTDPLNAQFPGNPVPFQYCYATPIDGRDSYAIFARMEQLDLNRTDPGGLCNRYYEVYSQGYPKSGWTPIAGC